MAKPEVDHAPRFTSDLLLAGDGRDDRRKPELILLSYPEQLEDELLKPPTDVQVRDSYRRDLRKRQVRRDKATALGRSHGPDLIGQWLIETLLKKAEERNRAELRRLIPQLAR